MMHNDIGLRGIHGTCPQQIGGREICFMAPHPKTQADGAAWILMLGLVVERKRGRENMISHTLALTTFT